MPRIPTQTLPTVAPAGASGAFQRVDARPEAFGADVARAGEGLARNMGNLASTLADNAIRLQEQQSSNLAKEADIEATRALNDLQYNPESGFLVRQGKNAVEGFQAAVERTGEIEQQVMQGLPNPRARELAKHAVAVRVEAARSAMARHTAVENRKWSIESSNARAVAGIEAAALAYNDDRAFGQAVAMARDEARQQGELQGWDEAAIGLKQQQYTEKAWKERLTAWRMHDPVGALASYQANASKMDPTLAATLGHQLYSAAAPVLAAQLNAAGGPPIPASSTVPAPEKNEVLPRGVRNNNPGNIVKSAVRWEGEVEGHDPRYTAFATPEAGIRAMAVNLQTYQEKYGLGTVEGIIGRWAPATENDTAAYVAQVAKDLGVKPDQPLNLADGKTLLGLTKAIIRHENGKAPYTDAQIAAGVQGKVPTTKARTFADVTMTEAATMLTGNRVVDGLPPDWKMHVVALARTQANQDQSQVREGLKYRLADDLAAYERGAAPPQPVTGTEVMRAYGQEEGARILARLDEAQQFGADVREVTTLPASRQAELLARRAPVAGEGFAEQARRHEQLTRAVEQVQKAREQDPAAFALTNTPAVMQAYRAMANTKDPAERAAASQAYAGAVLAEQQRLEVRDPQILAKNYVDEITRRFYAPAGDEAKDGGVDAGSVMQGLVSQWGRFWPLVGKQLSKSIPPGAVVIGLGVKPEAEQLISETLRMKPEQLRAGFAEPELKDLRELVRSNFEPLQKTLAFQGGGTQTYDNYVDTAEGLAIELLRRGMKPKDAAAKAFESMVGFKYEFEDAWRVPKAALGGGATVRGIRAGAHAARFDIAETGELAVPVGPASVRSEDLASQWRRTVQDNGFWLTSPGDNGLSLWVRSGLGAQPVLDAGGAPVRRTWEDLNALGTSVTAAFPGDIPGLADRMRGGKR